MSWGKCLVDVLKIHLKDDSVWAGETAQLVKCEDLSLNCWNPSKALCVIVYPCDSSDGKMGDGDRFLEALCSVNLAYLVKFQASLNKQDRQTGLRKDSQS